MSATFIGPRFVIAKRRAGGWFCAACPFEMTGLTYRDALKHFYINHGTDADADVARRDFPGVAVNGPNIPNVS